MKTLANILWLPKHTSMCIHMYTHNTSNNIVPLLLLLAYSGDGISECEENTKLVYLTSASCTYPRIWLPLYFPFTHELSSYAELASIPSHKTTDFRVHHCPVFISTVVNYCIYLWPTTGGKLSECRNRRQEIEMSWSASCPLPIFVQSIC